jgi:hypothetical protein
MTTGVERHHSEWLTRGLDPFPMVPVLQYGRTITRRRSTGQYRASPPLGSSSERRGGVDGAVSVDGSLAAQEALEIVWRHRPSEQIALPAGAVRSPQGRDLIGRLDALGDAPEP